jgi:hypothetical protein
MCTVHNVPPPFHIPERRREKREEPPFSPFSLNLSVRRD